MTFAHCVGEETIEVLSSLLPCSDGNGGICYSACWVKELALCFPRVTGVPLRALLLTHEIEGERANERLA